MGRVWIIIAITIATVSGVCYSWHARDMARLVAVQDTEIRDVKDSIADLTAYRDTLKAKGLVGARDYLTAHPK